MEWLNKRIKKNPVLSLLFPTTLGFFIFLGNLAAALNDGNIDGNEMHQLMSSASGLETLLLMIVMVAFKKKKKQGKHTALKKGK